jgi:hypothetical protein
VRDTVEELVLDNNKSIPLRVWHVDIYECQSVEQGCGANDPQINVPAHSTVVLRRLAVIHDLWHASYEVRFRAAPPADAATYAFTVPTSGPATALVAPLALATTDYRPIEATRSAAAWHMVNPSARISVWVEEFETNSDDSIRIELSGARMPFDTTGHVGANEYQWLPLLRDVPADVATLAALADTIRRAESLASVMPLDTSEVHHAAVLGLAPRGHLIVAPRSLGAGRWGACRYSAEPSATTLVVELVALEDWCAPPRGTAALRYNTFVTVLPSSIPIGESLPVCAAYTLRIPGGWEGVDWLTDATRCPADGPAANPREPNVLVLKRAR